GGVYRLDTIKSHLTSHSTKVLSLRCSFRTRRENEQALTPVLARNARAGWCDGVAQPCGRQWACEGSWWRPGAPDTVDARRRASTAHPVDAWWGPRTPDAVDAR